MFTNMPLFLRGVIILSLLLTLAIMFNVWDGLRGGYGWRWGYSSPERVSQWLPSLLAVIIYVAGSWWLRKRASARQIVAWSFLASAILPFIFLSRWGDPLYHQFTRVASGGASGPHLVAAQYTPQDIESRLKNWTDEQARFADDGISIHAALAPPGLPLLYYAAGQAFEAVPALASPLADELRPLQCHNLSIASYSNAQLASAMPGMVSPLWAALTVFPLFWLARRLTDEDTARWVVLYWALIPGIAMFTPVPNTVFPLMATGCIALLWRALERRAYRYAFAAGFVASVMTFLNFSILPLFLFCGLLALESIWKGLFGIAVGGHLRMPPPSNGSIGGRIHRSAPTINIFSDTLLGYHVRLPRSEPPRWSWSLEIGIAFGGGFVMVWVAWLLYGGPPPWDMLQSAMSQHLDLERAYLPWLALHLWDYAIFAGLPLALLSGWAIIRSWRVPSPASPFALSLGLSLILLDLSGTARGETGRVWQFFFPVTIVTATALLQGSPEAHHRIVFAGQAAAALVMVLFIPTISTEFTVPPEEPPTIADAAITASANALFDDTLRLVGIGGELDANQNLLVNLRWQVDALPQQPYYVAIIPVAPDGRAYRDGFVYQPFDGDYPATCWQPQQIITEQVVIPLEGNPPHGEWWLSLSVLDFHDFEPVGVRFPDGSTDRQAGVGPIVLD